MDNVIGFKNCDVNTCCNKLRGVYSEVGEEEQIRGVRVGSGLIRGGSEAGQK